LVPVHAFDESLHGVLLIGRREPMLFDAAEEAAVYALAAHVGIAIDNFETVYRLTELQAVQREIVHQLQEAVRPQLPAVEAAELGVHYLPADPSSPTGGDLYDCVVLPNGDLHLAVVDVMGKGVAATKDAVSVTHALRLVALVGCSMRDLVARAAALVAAQAPDLVATVLVVRYSPADGVAHVAGGGHPPALVVSADGDVRWVEAPGIAMGWPGAGSTTSDRRTGSPLYGSAPATPRPPTWPPTSASPSRPRASSSTTSCSAATSPASPTPPTPEPAISA